MLKVIKINNIHYATQNIFLKVLLNVVNNDVK